LKQHTKQLHWDCETVVRGGFEGFLLHNSGSFAYLQKRRGENALHQISLGGGGRTDYSFKHK